MNEQIPEWLKQEAERKYPIFPSGTATSYNALAILEQNAYIAGALSRSGGVWVNMVYDWHKKFGVDIGESPKNIQPSRFAMRHNILKEEVDELEEAFWLKDKGLPEIADAICDIIYVIIGTAIEFGLHNKLHALFSEVHRSNMSKLDENGQPVKREDGKILKSKLFSPPQLLPIIESKCDESPAADKGDAIEFAEWIEGTDYWYDKEDKVWHGGDCMEIEYTTQQLYELFRQSKSTKEEI